MKLFSFEHADGVRPGILLEDGRAFDLTLAAARRAPNLAASSLRALIEGGPEALAAVSAIAHDPTGLEDASLDFPGLRLAAPIPRPRKNIFCVGRNYVEHVKEGTQANKIEMKIPQAPQFFTKPPTAVIGPGASVRVARAVTERLDYEVELGVVIGKAGADIAPENAYDHIFGYTIVNDVTGRDLQRLHEQWFKGKGLDTTCPTGPFIITKDEIPDPRILNLVCRVNGETRQSAQVSMMIFDIPTLIASLSRGMTLEPGDIIATGTPSGVEFAMEPPRFLRQGDIVECQIDSIGTLRNPVETP